MGAKASSNRDNTSGAGRWSGPRTATRALAQGRAGSPVPRSMAGSVASHRLAGGADKVIRDAQHVETQAEKEQGQGKVEKPGLAVAGVHDEQEGGIVIAAVVK